jgi:hypothetical protein
MWRGVHPWNISRGLTIVHTELHNTCSLKPKDPEMTIQNYFVGPEVLTALVMKSNAFWDITPLVSCSTYFFEPEDGGDMFLRNVD